VNRLFSILTAKPFLCEADEFRNWLRILQKHRTLPDRQEVKGNMMVWTRYSNVPSAFGKACSCDPLRTSRFSGSLLKAVQ